MQFVADTLTYPEAPGSGSTAVLQTGVEVLAISGTLSSSSARLTSTDGTAVRGTHFQFDQPQDTQLLWDFVSHGTSNRGIKTFPNTNDEPDKQFTWTLTKLSPGDTRFNLGTRTTTTVIIRDDDPTIVTLSRVGSGAVSEGGTVEFTVMLGRALVAGETIDVPLSIGGTGVTTSDWSLAKKSGSTNTGVTLSGTSTSTPTVRFSGAGARTATLELTPADDGPSEGTETYRIALGGNSAFDAASLGTNVGGGADPHATTNSFSVAVTDRNVDVVGAALVFSQSSLGVMEGGSASYTVKLVAAPTGAVTVGIASDNADVTVSPTSLTFNAGNWRNARTVTVNAASDADAANDRATLTHTASGGGYAGVSGTVPVLVSEMSTAASQCETGASRLFRGCVWITGSSAITEGGTATFTVHAFPAPSHPLDVRFAVWDASGLSRFIGRTAYRVTLTIPAGQTSASHSVGTIDDGTEEADGHVTGYIRPKSLHVGGANRKSRYHRDNFYYRTIEPNQARVTVRDNDGAPPAHVPPAVSVSVSSASVSKGGYAHFCTSVDGFTKRTPAAHEPGIFNVELKVTTAGGDVAKAVSQQYRTGVTESMCSSIDTAPWAGETLTARVLTPGQRLHLGRNITPYVPGATSSATLTVGASPSGLSFGTGSRQVAEFRLAPGRQQIQYGRLRTVNNLVNLNVDIVPAATSQFNLEFDLSGTATRGTDYTIPRVTGSRGRVAVPSGASRVTVPVTIIDDTIEDDGETVVLSLRASGGYQPASPGSVTLTIRNDDPDDAPSEPAVTIAAGTGPVTEGGDATFTLTATPAPAADLSVSVTVATDGDYGVTAGTRTVTIPTTGSATLTLATAGDETDEADGSVSVTVTDGAGYTVGSSADATVSIQDDDAPSEPEVTIAAGASPVTEGGDAVFTLTATPAPAADLSVSVTVAADGDYGVTAGTRTVTIPATGSATLTLATAGDEADEADGSVSVTVAAGTGYTVGSSADATVSVQDDDAAPGTPDWTDFQTVVDRIVEARDNPTNAWARGGGNAVHVAKWNRVLEAIGYDTGTGVSPMPASEIHANAAKWPESTFKAASVYLKSLDDSGSDEPAVTVSGGNAVTEGGSAAFTIAATPAPASPLAVSVTVATAGDYGVTAGTRTVTIPTTGSYTLTLATAGDTTDEPDGSVSVTVKAGTGYTVGSSASATVAVRDDDAPLPAVTIAAGSAVTEGGSASFTLTASPAPTSPLAVSVTIATAGEYGISAGKRTVSIPTTGSYTLSLPTTDDATDEPDGSVTATVGAGSGYTVGTSASGTVAIRDDDEPPPVVTIAAQAASVTEGGDAAFTLTADRAPDADLTVKLSVSETGTGDHVAAADEGPTTALIAKGATEAVFRVATVNDAVDEPDGAAVVTVEAGAGYTVGAPASGTVTVLDDDITPLPELSVADETAREGVDWLLTFTVRLSAPASEAVEVRVATRPSTPVSAEPRHDYWPLAGQVLRFGAGETEKPVQVLVYDDSHDEEAETFELVLSNARGADIADGVAVGTIVNDDPMPAAFLARFGRTVAEQALDGIAARMAAPRTPGMQGALAGQAVNFGPTESPGSWSGAGGTPAAGGVPSAASGTAPATGKAALAMAEIARSFGDAGHSGHDAGGFGNGPGHGIAGPGTALSPQSRTMTAREALLGSSFSLTGETDGSGGSMAFWGRASQGSFDGREGTFSLDGTVTTGMLGADYARGRWLIGLALTQSEGEGDYRDTKETPRPPSQTCPAEAEGLDAERCRNAVRAGDGKVEASLTAAIPYAAFQASERLKLWGAAGHGAGEVTLKTAMGGSYRADTSWTMAAAGMRGDLLAPPAEGSGPALAVTSDALWARTSSEKTAQLAASDSDVTRLRVGLEGSYRVAMENGGSLVPKLEIGARHDGGDAETGFGVELGGGVRWTDPGLGLSLDLSGRTLLAHGNDDLKDRGFSAALAYDPAPATQRGASLNLRQDFGGRAQGGLDALFQPDPLDDRAGSEATSRWAVEAAYGLPAFGGRWTGSPHAGFGLATGARDYSLGWRLTPEAANAPDLSFGVKATRRESDTVAAEHTFGIELTARW